MSRKTWEIILGVSRWKEPWAALWNIPGSHLALQAFPKEQGRRVIYNSVSTGMYQWSGARGLALHHALSHCPYLLTPHPHSLNIACLIFQNYIPAPGSRGKFQKKLNMFSPLFRLLDCKKTWCHTLSCFLENSFCNVSYPIPTTCFIMCFTIIVLQIEVALQERSTLTSFMWAFHNLKIAFKKNSTILKEHKHSRVHCYVIYNHQDMEAA